MIKKLRIYLNIFRLRTLILSFSGILLGSFLIDKGSKLDYNIFAMALVTTLCLQILSNLANDLGDFQKGTDNKNRLGPERGMQSGLVGYSEMLKLIFSFTILSLVSGLYLIYLAYHIIGIISSIILFIIGIFAIIAAIKYTIGKSAYAYKGHGDFYVIIFFGLVSVLGSYYLQTGYLNPYIILPATSSGLLAAAVLNTNNLRDYDNDKKYNKNTIVVKLGVKKAKKYHAFLIFTPFVLNSIYLVFNRFSNLQFLFLAILIPAFLHYRKVYYTKNLKEIDSELKIVSILSLLISITISIWFLF
ncbi:MAG: 1,4-dihydroxy-2-naphthoate octaprenyltransferase [Marinifilaceae bacterium]|jgi:1,4-dihydroxy-2-naphthoate octaprenyltransferase|nr:1,4-dihydroxy-2-naphthoate octaprenyltransferase [Marinifilaceae bacterium]